MTSSEPVTITRDVEAAVVPVGTKVTLQQGEQAYVTQALGGSYTVVVNGNMFRIEGKDADALGFEVAEAKRSALAGQPLAAEDLEKTGDSQTARRILGEERRRQSARAPSAARGYKKSTPGN